MFDFRCLSGPPLIKMGKNERLYELKEWCHTSDLISEDNRKINREKEGKSIGSVVRYTLLREPHGPCLLPGITQTPHQKKAKAWRKRAETADRDMVYPQFFPVSKRKLPGIRKKLNRMQSYNKKLFD